MKDLGESFVLPFMFLVKFQSRWVVTSLNPSWQGQSVSLYSSQVTWPCFHLNPSFLHLGFVSSSLFILLAWLPPAHGDGPFLSLEKVVLGNQQLLLPSSLHIPQHTLKSAPVPGLLRSGLAIIIFCHSVSSQDSKLWHLMATAADVVSVRNHHPLAR